jgi:uncharacterized protein (DUF305 family)
MKFIVIFVAFLYLSVCEGPPSPNVDHSKHDHTQSTNGITDHSKMESSPGVGDAPHELQFIDTMIAHHQGAVDMALLVNTRSQRDVMKKLAQGILKEQRQEIAQMQQWREAWFAGAKSAVNMDFPGMKKGMSGMDMGRLNSLKANEFDIEFLRQMIPHHEGAIEMAKALKAGNEYADMQQLADSIIASQTAEVAQMKEWLSGWSGSAR